MASGVHSQQTRNSRLRNGLGYLVSLTID